MIIKSFRKEGFGFFGQNIESWTKTPLNEVEDIPGLSEEAAGDHLSVFFKKYFPYPPKKILDGGCGLGKHVIAYRKMGYDIIGVDFSVEVIRRVKKEVDGNLPIYTADVTALPFEDGFFDCYFLGGVIEHFEEGPNAPLREARRVLKKNGYLLATVPYISLLRRLYFSIFPTKKGNGFLQKKCKKCQCDPYLPKSYNFCEYFFDVISLTPYFKANDFLIEKTYPTDLLWGEIGLPLRKLMRRYQEGKTKIINKIIGVPASEADKKPFIKRLICDFLITENRNNIFFRIPLTLLNYLNGHMVLFIARAI